MPFIDIKSGGLCDILRDELHDIKAVSLTENKPSVIGIALSSRSTLTWNVDFNQAKYLFHFLSALDGYAEHMDIYLDYGSAHAEHPLLLIDHKHVYASTLQRLE